MSESVHTPLEVAEGILSGKYTLNSVFVLVNQIADARAEAQRLRADRRERIATAALQGLLACPEVFQFEDGPFKGWARCAVKYADALIAELDKEGAP